MKRLLLATMIGVLAISTTGTNAQENGNVTIRPDGTIVTHVQGHWQTVVFNIYVIDPVNGRFLVSGEDDFTGDITGHSHFFATGTLSADGSASGFSEEAIAGVLSDGSTGGTILEAHQPFDLDADGNFTETSPIVGGDGSLAGASGRIHYTGYLDPLGLRPPREQGGEYHGVLIRKPQQ